MRHRGGIDPGVDGGRLAVAACYWFPTPWVPATLQLLPTKSDQKAQGMWAFSDLRALEVWEKEQLTDLIPDSLSLKGPRDTKEFVRGQGRKEPQKLP